MSSIFGRTPDPNDPGPWLRGDQFPVRDACNPFCPEESWLWTLVGVPGTNGAPMVMPIPMLQVYSAHLFRLFGRCPEDAALKYRPPSGRESNWMTAVGTWVPLDAPDPESRSAFSTLPFDAQVQLKREALMALTPEEVAEILGVDPS